jgi:ribosomal protein S18 acetylase RimI-like enzyme
MIRRLTPGDADPYIQLRRMALLEEPFAFASSPEDDQAQSPAVLQELLTSEDEAIFGCFMPQLVGVAGIYREPGQKSRHKAQLWGVYVTKSHRGRGIGAALVEAALGFARSLNGVRLIQLSVTERAAAALELYRRLGFVSWGVEPDALQVGDSRLAEHHMYLTLDENEPYER